MRWSKVRKLVHDSFAESVRGRVRVDVFNSHEMIWHDAHGEGRIVVDGQVVAHVDPCRLRLLLPVTSERTQYRESLVIVNPYGHILQEGEKAGTYMVLPQACWQYLHSSLNDSLRSADPIVSSLAVLNARVGLTRLRRALTRDLHPLTRAMAEFRLEAEREARRAA